MCLNVAEAAGRTSRADEARVFGIARGEALEVAAALAGGALEAGRPRGRGPRGACA
ncbi:MAG: four helix bundle protein [Polyangiaceae bacterium]|nr:four helix bundle protein [Polyangiaceae bacterium]